jgi:16S rRNA processing protein RimM
MARVVGAVGIQGWIKLKTFTEDPEGLGDFDRWLVRTPQGWREMVLEEFAVRPNGTAVKLEGCEDRDTAERLKGAEVAIRRTDLGEAEEGTMFWVDLIGLDVMDEGGENLGKVEAFFETGETSVMVVKGTRERMIPFVPGYVKAVDREAKRITVDWKADYDA